MSKRPHPAPEPSPSERLRRLARIIERLSPERTDPEAFLMAKQLAARDARRIAIEIESRL